MTANASQSHLEDSDLTRFERQWRFAPIGQEGQRQIAKSKVLVVGCGALGSVAAEQLVRAGVGSLRIVDRDFLEWNNLQRQSLYDEADVRSGLPKAVIAADKLRRIHSQATIEPLVADVRSDNILSLLEQVDAIVDGTDNFETRFLINDAALETNTPWVFAGCLGASGQTMTIRPGHSACLRCLMPEGPPPPGTLPTCDTGGILAPIIHVMAAIQVCEVLKLLCGSFDAVSRHLTAIDLWNSSLRRIELQSLRDGQQCPACEQGARDWLRGTRGSSTAVLCGRNAVQLAAGQGTRVDLEAIARRFSHEQIITTNPFLLRLAVGESTFTLFQDGRVIVSGTEDPLRARALVAQHLGM